jgi:DNA helicase-2/ATP-dependent DNA helicase PcrA
MDYLAGLNAEQYKAASHNTGPMLVVAGAGTGKTRVITHRIAHLISKGLAKPEQILALTYTDKAAREMTERLEELIGWDAAGVNILTYNAFGGRLLHRFGHHIGRGTRGGLLSDEQKAMLLLQRIKHIEFKYYPPQSLSYEFAERMAVYISSLQNAAVTSTDYLKYATDLDISSGMHQAEIMEQHDLAAIYEAYETLKLDSETYDYTDQVATAVQILQQKPNLAERLQNEYKYLLVDEYQDTSPVQDAMLRLIVPPGGNIFAVGDDDQAIYGFRGSDIANILKFTEHFKVDAAIVLTENYRSGQSILDAAYRLISNNNPDRLEVRLGINKRLISRAPAAEIIFSPYISALSEQAEVSNAIKTRIDSGESAASIAVLARGKATLRSYAKSFRSLGIPFAMSAELSIFEQRELLSLWYLLQWIMGSASDEAIGQVVIGPLIGWELVSWQSVVLRAKKNLVGCEEALGELANTDEKTARLLNDLTHWRQLSTSLNVRELAVMIVTQSTQTQATSLIDRLKVEAQKDEMTPRVIRVINDLKRLFEHMDDFATASSFGSADASLTAYLSNFPQPPVIKVDEAVGQSDGVQLLTVHASKGLEFETVYVVNVSNRAWSEMPDKGLVVPNVLDKRINTDPVAEQRRLMYVAVTRAKRELFLSAPIASAGGQKQAVSNFIPELFETVNYTINHDQIISDLDNSLTSLQRFYPFQTEIPDRLPFEQADGWIQISVSDLDRFEKYPHDFLMERVLGLAQDTGPHLAFGTTVHAVIQQYYEELLAGRTPAKQLLIDKLDEIWTDQGYPDRITADAARERANLTIVNFLLREAHSEKRVLATELPIKFELPEFKLRLIGRIDATFETPDGLEVRDFKTGVRRDADKLADEAKKSLQLRTYALALAEKIGRTPSCVTLDYVVTGVTGTAELTPRILVNHRIKLGQLAERLRAHDFDPGTPSDHNHAKVFKYFGVGEAE